MKLARVLSEIEAKKVQSLILFGGVFTTLAIWTKLEDPINLPKMSVLAIFAAVVLGLSLPVLLNIKKTSSGSQRIALVLIGIFALGLLISTIATDVKYTAIFGEYHRNNGALSYISMALLMVVAALVFDLKSSGKYLKFYAVTALILTFYGFMQGSGKDPVGWVIDYNPFITTLGNPNFTSGFLGIAAIAIYLLTIEAKDRKVQIAWLIGLLVDLYILRKSGSIQGLFGFLIGAAIITIVKLWLVKKRYGQAALITTGVLGIPVVLAVLNIGPLASKLYQGTLRNRLDYWHAAFNMFKEHPIFGIGIDRFGEYYREYAVQVQVVQGQTTDNAHSIYMQLLATGGLALFIPYVVLIGYITYIGLRALIKAEGAKKLRISGIFGIWLGSATVNIVAIDNLGVAVWFWITGGVLITLTKVESTEEPSVSNQKKSKSGKSIRNNSSIEFPWPVLSAAVLLCLALIAVGPGISKSHNSFVLKNNSNNLSASAFVAELNSQVSGSQNNLHNLIVLNDIALRQGEIELSLKMSERIREIDPRSFYGQYLPAIAYEATGKPTEAIEFRKKLLKLDPWGNANMIQLIKNYLAVGNRGEAEALAAKIRENYPGSQSDTDAAALLAS
jgi:O-antigen ligase